MVQPYQHQHNANDDSDRDHLANVRCLMFFDLGLTVIALGASTILLFPANGLRDHAKLGDARIPLS
jgi:hypothetical protein